MSRLKNNIYSLEDKKKYAPTFVGAGQTKKICEKKILNLKYR